MELLASPPTPAGLVFGPTCLCEGTVKQGEERGVAKKRRVACAQASCFAAHGGGSAGAGSDSQLGVVKRLRALAFQRSAASQCTGSPPAPMPGQHPGACPLPWGMGTELMPGHPQGPARRWVRNGDAVSSPLPGHQPEQTPDSRGCRDAAADRGGRQRGESSPPRGPPCGSRTITPLLLPLSLLAPWNRRTVAWFGLGGP